MARLVLRAIKCLDPQEYKDELYLTFNGTRTALPNMTAKVVQPLNGEFMFSGTQELRLYENDGGHWYDKDDFIHAIPISESPGDSTLNFKGDGAEYAIDVSVFSDAQPRISAILRLNSITCLEQAEFFTDELYFTFNGTKRALPNMMKGQAKALDDEILFQEFSRLSLFENDGDHWYDRDDYVGSHIITASPENMTLLFEAPPFIGGNNFSSPNPFGGAYPARYEMNVSILLIEGEIVL